MPVNHRVHKKLEQIAQELQIAGVIRLQRHRFESAVGLVHQLDIIKPPEASPDMLVLRLQLLPVTPIPKGNRVGCRAGGNREDAKSSWRGARQDGGSVKRLHPPPAL